MITGGIQRLRLLYLAVAFIVLTISAIVVLNVTVPVLLQRDPVSAYYFVLFMMALYAIVSFGLARLAKRTV